MRQTGWSGGEDGGRKRTGYLEPTANSWAYLCATEAQESLQNSAQLERGPRSGTRPRPRAASRGTLLGGGMLGVPTRSGGWHLDPLGGGRRDLMPCCGVGMGVGSPWAEWTPGCSPHPSSRTWGPQHPPASLKPGQKSCWAVSPQDMSPPPSPMGNRPPSCPLVLPMGCAGTPRAHHVPSAPAGIPGLGCGVPVSCPPRTPRLPAKGYGSLRSGPSSCRSPFWWVFIIFHNNAALFYILHTGPGWGIESGSGLGAPDPKAMVPAALPNSGQRSGAGTAASSPGSQGCRQHPGIRSWSLVGYTPRLLIGCEN